jgi:YVTN family beta-propeller protein
MTPNGTRLFVANHTAGTVCIIDPLARSVIGTVSVGGHPMALAIANNGDADDQDERVFVTQFFAELIPGGPGEGFDTGKHGVVRTFPVANPSAVTRITLSPLANTGFTADRTAFCPQSNPDPTALHSTIFCPERSMGRLPGWDLGEDRRGRDSRRPDHIARGKRSGAGGIGGAVSTGGVVA